MLHPRIVDMTGQKCGRLDVLEFAGTRVKSNGRSHAAFWVCRCDCGRTVIVNGWSLRAGRSKSCGCGVGLANQRRRKQA